MGEVFGSCLSNGLCRWLERFSSEPDVEDLREEMERIELREHRRAAVDLQGLCGRKRAAGATVKHVQMDPGLGSLHPPVLFPCPSAITVSPPMQQGCPRDAVYV